MATIPSDTFCWAELCTPNLQNAVKFYQSALHWTSKTYPKSEGGSYIELKANEQPIAGAYELTAEMKKMVYCPLGRAISWSIMLIMLHKKRKAWEQLY